MLRQYSINQCLQPSVKHRNNNEISDTSQAGHADRLLTIFQRSRAAAI